MKLPEKFKFVHYCNEYPTYIAAQEGSKNDYNVSWSHGLHDEGEVDYSAFEVAENIRNGTWVVLPESFPQLIKLSESLQALISEKNDASELAYDELKSLLLTRALITRMLDDRN